MTNDEIRDEVVKALKRVAPEASQLDPARELREQLEIDSYDFLEFVVALDKSLHVPIPESDYRRLSTLDACVDYLAARMQTAGRKEPLR